MNLNDLVDYFDPANYPVDPATGRHEVPYEDILAALTHLFPNGYFWKVEHQGFRPDGSAYVIIELTVTDQQSFSHTVPGSAENDGQRRIGFAGLQQLALRNAVLRGLRMGEKMYNNNKATMQQNQVQNMNAGMNAGPNFKPAIQQRFGSNKYPPKVWDGSQPLKNGPYAGKPYSVVTDADIEKWASGSSPNVLAVKERQRRIDDGLWTYPQTSQTTTATVLPNNPFTTSF